MKNSLIALVVVLGLASIGARFLLQPNKRVQVEDPSLAMQEIRRAKLERTLTGRIVFHRKNGPERQHHLFDRYRQRNIYMVHVNAERDDEPILLAQHGRRPRWSPDGQRIAFLRGRSVMLMNADGSEQRAVADTAHEPRSLAFHPNNRAIIYTDDRALRQVNLETGEISTLLKGPWWHEVDITADGQTVVATVRKTHTYHVMRYDVASGREALLGDGCSASLSPDGQLVTNNIHGHEVVLIRRLDDGSVVSKVSRPGRWTFDNQAFANHNDWMTSVNEGMHNEVFVHRISEDWWAQITYCGDCDYPDLFIDKLKLNL